MKDYEPENTRNYRYILVVINNFSKFVWTVLLKNKNAQVLKEFFEKILKTSKRKPILIETEDGGEFVNEIFTDLLNNVKIKRYSRNTYVGAVFAKRFGKTFRDLKRPVFEKKMVIGLIYYPH